MLWRAHRLQPGLILKQSFYMLCLFTWSTSNLKPLNTLDIDSPKPHTIRHSEWLQLLKPSHNVDLSCNSKVLRPKVGRGAVLMELLALWENFKT